MVVAVIVLAVIVLAQMVERVQLVRRYEQTRSLEASRAAQERTELAARVQGIPVMPRPAEFPSQEVVAEPDEFGMVGKVIPLVSEQLELDNAS